MSWKIKKKIICSSRMKNTKSQRGRPRCGLQAADMTTKFIESTSRIKDLCGQRFLIQELELTLTSALHHGQVGVSVFKGTWGSQTLVVKCAMAPLLFSEPCITEWMSKRTTNQAHFPRFLFFSTIDDLQFLGLEYIPSSSLYDYLHVFHHSEQAIHTFALEMVRLAHLVLLRFALH